jgi:hypothetical protein
MNYLRPNRAVKRDGTLRLPAPEYTVKKNMIRAATPRLKVCEVQKEWTQ